MSSRQLAIANENAEIDASIARATAAKAQPVTALQAIASRLQISQQNLMNTLKSTAFKGASESEFAALIVVCNEYRLNPLLKEIYAFPAKGGGIVPMVSVDGWIRIMNDHPQFDGIDFDYVEDKTGKTVAIESIIYRKDRTRPVKVLEYMDECKGQSAPWQKSPRRMLRHRALIQGARIAFGFSGIASEGDEDEFIEGQVVQSVPALPSSQSLAEALNDEIPAFDKDTGEVLDSRGMTEVTEEEACALDAATEGRADEEMGEAHNETQAEAAAQTVNDIDGPLETQPAADDEKPVWWGKVQWLREAIAGAKNKQYLKDADFEFTNIRAGLPDEVIAEIEALLTARRGELTKVVGEVA